MSTPEDRPPEAVAEVAAARGGLDDTPERIGKYRITGTLGHGGMGVVYSGRDEDLHRDVAIKVVRSSGDAGKRLFQEARALARLADPNVITVHEVGDYDAGVFVAMELVRGQTLDEWAAEHTSWRDRAAVLAQAARGLEAAHRAGLVHRDFKPANVIVGDDGRVRVLDFGLAVTGDVPHATAPIDQATELSRLTATGMIMGTPLYMAPEQWSGNATDHRTDQFAFCLVAYEILFFRRAFHGDPIEALGRAVIAGDVHPPPASDVPARISEAVMRGLAPDPEDRHRSMAPLIAVLDPPGHAKDRRIIGAALAIAAVLVAGFVVFGGSSDHRTLDVGSALEPFSDVVAGSSLPPVDDEVVEGDPLEATSHRLSNGLTVYISPRRNKPEISAHTVFRVGSGDEPSERPGLAVAAVRLIGGGSSTIGTIDFDRERPLLDELRGLSDRLAGATGERRPAVLAEIERVSRAAAALQIPNELSLALSEIGAEPVVARVDRDSTTFATRFPSNRLSTWIELEAERLRSPVVRGYFGEVSGGDGPPRFTIADVEGFVARWYVPNNAALILVGDVDRATAIAELEAAFAGWTPRRMAPFERLAAVTGPAPNADQRAEVTWQTPGLLDPDSPALLALARYLEGDLESTGLAARFEPDAGAGVLRVSTDASNVGAVIDRVARIRDGGVDAELLEAIAAYESVDALRRAEDDDNRVAQLRSAFLHRLGWAEVIGQRRLALEVGGDRLRDVAARHLAEAPAVSAPDRPVSVPLKRPTIATLSYARQRHGELVNRLLAEPVVLAEPRFLLEGRHYRTAETAAGTLIAVPDPGGRLFTLRQHWTVGDATIRHACAALDSMINPDPTHPAVARRRLAWLRLGLAITARCSADEIEIVARGEDRKLADSLGAINALIDGRQLPPDAFEGRVAEWARQAAAAAETPEGVARDALERGRFGAPPPLDAARIGETEIRAALARLAGVQRGLIYFGPRDIEPIAELVGHPAVAVGRRPARLVAAPAVLVVDDPRTTPALVDIALPLARPAEREIVAVELLDLILRSDGNPISAALGERGVDGGASAHIELPVDRGDEAFASITLRVRPELVTAAVGAAIGAVRELEVSADQLEAARQLLDARYRSSWVAPDEVGEVVLGWLRSGLERDPRLERFRVLPAVELGSVAAIAGRLRDARPVITAVGPGPAIDAAALRAAARR